jgi:predicted Zn-dependent protease
MTISSDPTAAVAEDVLRLVRERAADAEAEVIVRQGVDALTRFANSFIHQNVAEETSHVSLRVALDGRVAATRLDGPADRARLASLVEGAFEAAAVRPVDPDWPGVAEREPVQNVDHWDEATADAGPDDRARRVAAFVTAGGGLETAGACATTAQAVTVANSRGQHASGRFTVAELDGIARTGTSDGSARHRSVRLDDVDGAALGRRAAGKARRAADAADLKPGRYEVVLEPQCVANVLAFLFAYGFNARAVEEKRSFARVGEAQFDPAISLRDDVADENQVGVAFDAEGTPKRPLDIVRDGVTTGLLHNRRTAREAGTRSTGHAVEGAEELGALAENPVLAGGGASGEDLLAGVGRGLLVTDFWYTRILDPRTQVVTGLTRNGVWLIEDGRVVRPVTNLRFTQSYVEALGPENVRAIGAARALIQDGFAATHLVPSVHLASWNFTGGARG